MRITSEEKNQTVSMMMAAADSTLMEKAVLSHKKPGLTGAGNGTGDQFRCVDNWDN